MTETVDTVHSQTYVVHREQYGDDWIEATFRSRPEAEQFIERYYVSVGGQDDDWSLYVAEEPTVVVTLPKPTEFRPDVRHAYWGPDDTRDAPSMPWVMVERGLLYCHETGAARWAWWWSSQAGRSDRFWRLVRADVQALLTDSVDVEKLRELVEHWRKVAAEPAGDCANLAVDGAISATLRGVAGEIADLLDSTPSVTPGHPVKAGAGYDCGCGECLHRRSTPGVDYGPAETQYGVRWPDGSPVFTFASRKEAEWYASTPSDRGEVVQRDSDGSWRPVDGAPGEDSQA